MLTMAVSCDHEGCEVAATPTGWETNGANIEAVYGLPEWDLDKDDHRCPKHQRVRAHECDHCCSTIHATKAEAIRLKWMCDDCRPVEMVTEARLKAIQ